MVTDSPEACVGVTLFDGAEAGPVPAAFLAVTVNVYDVPFVKPKTVSGPDDPMAIFPSGLDVTVYKVIGLPPLDAGGKKLTVACALFAVALAPVGGPGTVTGVTGVTLFDGAEAGPVPAAFVAVTVNV
jgi:hypothetical protein